MDHARRGRQSDHDERAVDCTERGAEQDKGGDHQPGVDTGTERGRRDDRNNSDGRADGEIDAAAAS